jgi:predicted RNA methylase
MTAALLTIDIDSARDTALAETPWGVGRALMSRPRAHEYTERADRLLVRGFAAEAAELYRAALLADADYLPAIVGFNRAARRAVPRWHFAMMNDIERNHAYERAIAAAVRPDHHVLDIGTGAGLLALLAARQGAAQVTSCEGVSLVAELAQRIVERNGYRDRIRILNKMSTELVVGGDLPDRADVLVTEIVDCGLLGEGILPTVQHARHHLLKEGASVIPCAATVWAQLIESEEIHRHNHVDQVSGFTMREFNQLSSLEYFDTRLATYQHCSLTRPFKVFRFDLAAGEARPQEKTLPVQIVAAGRCHAVVFWFDLELTTGIFISNRPENESSHWKQAVQCLPLSPLLEVGELVDVSVRHDSTRILFTAVRPSGRRPDGSA